MTAPTALRALLTQARARIADPAHWCRGWFAKTRNGSQTAVHAADATCWCALGAIFAGAHCPDHGGSAAAAMAVEWLTQHGAHALFGETIAAVNDTRGHAAVLRCFDAALAALEDETL